MSIARYTFEYLEMNFFFISLFYDVPLSGLCKVNNKIHTFSIVSFDAHLTSNDGKLFYNVYELSSIEKLKQILKKWGFELCVGTHMSYPQRAQKRYYHMRKPYWFWKRLFNLYYGKKIK